MKTKEEIDKEFDKLTPDSFVDDNSYYDEKEWLKNNEHLYTGTMYDEPAFTLDKEKVRIFIHSKLAQQKQEMVEEIDKYICENKGIYPFPTIEEEVAREIQDLIITSNKT